MAKGFDRSAVMRAAHEEWRDCQRRGWDSLEGPDRWTFPHCLRFAQAQARARQTSGFAAVEEAMVEALAGAKDRAPL